MHPDDVWQTRGGSCVDMLPDSREGRHKQMDETSRIGDDFFPIEPIVCCMGRVNNVLSRAKYAALFAAIGAFIGGLISREAASTGAAAGALLGASIGNHRASDETVSAKVKSKAKNTVAQEN